MLGGWKNMIHLVRDYFLNIDKQSGGCYTVGKAQSCVSERVLLSRPRYYPTLAVAVASTAEIALRDAIAAGEVQTLQEAAEELRRIRDEILTAVGGKKVEQNG